MWLIDLATPSVDELQKLGEKATENLEEGEQETLKRLENGEFDMVSMISSITNQTANLPCHSQEIHFRTRQKVPQIHSWCIQVISRNNHYLIISSD